MEKKIENLTVEYQAMPKACDKWSPATWVAPGILEAPAILSATTVEDF